MQQTISVRMPDGTIIQGVPEGVTQEEVLRRYNLTQAPSQALTQAPEKPPSQGFPMSLREAGERYAKGGVPGLLFGAATAEPSTASEQSLEFLKGIPEAITGIPDMIRSLAPVARTIMGGMGRGPAQDVRESAEVGKGLVKGVTEQGTIPARGAAALLAPEKFEAPSDEEFKRHARGQGAALGGAILGRAAGPALGKAAKYIDEAPVRKGYTTLNPKTLAPELPVNAIKVEMGKRIPTDAPKGALFDVHESVKTAAKALGGDASDELTKSLRSTFSRAFPDLIDAVQQNPYLRGPIGDPARAGAAAQWSRNRIWREGYEPAFKEAGPISLDGVADKLKARLPIEYTELDPKKGAALSRIYDRRFKGKSLSSEQFHQVVKGARSEIQTVLGKNPFEKQAMLNTPEGQVAQAHYEVLRDHLYDHVQNKTKVDLRPIGDAYGAASELEEAFLGMAQPRSILEEIFTSYTFPTPRAIAARVGERVGKHMISDPKLLEKAFAQYAKEFADPKKGAAERAKVTQPFWVQKQLAAAPQQAPKTR